jgi:hypothetical protein
MRNCADGSGARTRTWNKSAKVTRVANYTTPDCRRHVSLRDGRFSGRRARGCLPRCGADYSCQNVGATQLGCSMVSLQCGRGSHERRRLQSGGRVGRAVTGEISLCRPRSSLGQVFLGVLRGLRLACWRGITMGAWRLAWWARVGFLLLLGALLVCGPPTHAGLWHDRAQASHRVRTATQAGRR